MNEQQGFSTAGIPTVFLVTLLAFAGLALEGYGLVHQAPAFAAIALGILMHVITVFMSKGFFQVAPNEGQVLQLFGKYHGTVREEGLRWTNPFCSRRRVSLRVRNFESGKLKVNDSNGNPIEIATAFIERINNRILTGELYKALRETRKLIEYEKGLLDHALCQQSLCAGSERNSVAAPARPAARRSTDQ